MPQPSTEPRPLQTMSVSTPSCTRAARTDSARALDNRTLETLLVSGAPFACPSHTTANSGNAFNTRAISPTVSETLTSMLTLLGSNAIFRFKAFANKSFSKSRLSSRLMVGSASGMVTWCSCKALGSKTNMRTCMPTPSSLPRPTTRMECVTPSAITAVFTASARRCESLIRAALLVSGVPFVCPSHLRLKVVGKALRILARLLTVCMSEIGTTSELGSNSSVPSSASANNLFSKASCSSRDIPEMSGIVASFDSRALASTTRIRKQAPMPAALPWPTQTISLPAPSMRTAVRTASARACDNFRFMSLFSSGLPFVWPSMRMIASGKALRARAIARMSRKFDGGTSWLFGSKAMPSWRIFERRSSRALSSSSCEKPSVSGMSNSHSGSLARMRTHMPKPCEQPRPKHSMRFCTPSLCSAAARRSARTCDNRCLLSLSSSGRPLV
mmetsp:Transcript_34579/g.98363  ORF Transcript_34579/g.98363 Transcript_34579/m.98363 type:complete len:444 (-) Transcript_34579:1155-2486(-)